MHKKHIAEGCFALLGILFLILDGKTALTGAQEGIDLCIRVVIPSLFPLFLLSMIVTGSLAGMSLPILAPLAKYLGTPSGAESILLIGFLGGYPAGAQAVASAYRCKCIQKKDADRLLSFCSNAGPAFLFGMVRPMFEEVSAPFSLWGIHIASAFLVAALLPPSSCEAVTSMPQRKVSLTQAMHSSIQVMATVCAWILVFRVILEFLDRWFLWLLPVTARTVVYAVLELSNGCIALQNVPEPGLRFVLCSGMLAWGGLCVAIQTHAVAEGLSIAAYLKGKLIQTILSLLLSASIVLDIWLPTAALLLFFAILVQKTQNRGSNPVGVGI